MPSFTRWLSKHATESPALFWSIFIGALGPVMVLTIRPLRRSLGYQKPEDIPLSYPLPQRSRRVLPDTYDDPVKDIERYTMWDKIRDTIASVVKK